MLSTFSDVKSERRIRSGYARSQDVTLLTGLKAQFTPVRKRTVYLNVPGALDGVLTERQNRFHYRKLHRSITYCACHHPLHGSSHQFVIGNRFCNAELQESLNRGARCYG